MPRPVRGKDVAPIIRGAFLRAVKMLNDDAEAGRGPDLTGLILESLQTNVLATLKAISAFVPREHMLLPDEGEDGQDHSPIYAIVIPRKEMLPTPAIEGEDDADMPGAGQSNGPSALDEWRRKTRHSFGQRDAQ